LKINSTSFAHSYAKNLFIVFLLLTYNVASNLLYGQASIEEIRNLLIKESDRHDLSRSDLAHIEVLSNYIDKGSKVNYITLQQSIDGLSVHNAFIQLAIKQDGTLINLHSSATSAVQSKAQIQFKADIQKVFEKALSHKLENIATSDLKQIANHSFSMQSSGLKKNAIAEKILFRTSSDKILSAWRVEFQPKTSADWWNVIIADSDLRVLDQYNYNRECVHASTGVHHSHGRFELCSDEHHEAQMTDATGAYNVFPYPLESPIFGPRALIQDASDPLASPFGWHDTNGQAGAEHTITRGNNTFVYEDASDNDLPGYSPNGGNNLIFDYPYIFENTPIQNRDAALTNLFYWNNIIHDKLYHNGFDEESGNFQQNNYGRGGLQNDHVLVEGQDGGGTNNANFATPPDGSNPRMQVYLWYLGLGNFLRVLSPENIAGGYSGSTAEFGPEIPEIPITAEIVLVDDGSGNPTLGCNNLVNAGDLQGKIALFDRGECTFVSKVQNAQNAGALAVIIVNNQPNGVVQMGGTSTTITIPVIMITQADGNLIKSNLPGVIAEFGGTSTGEVYDCAFDNGVIAHEYGHGISNRLTAGPSVVTCLFNEEQMGEGWSDFFSLVFSHLPEHTSNTPRGIGNFVTGNPTDGPGIRPFPYTRNMTINPHTYISIRNVSIPHGVGSVWCAMLWDLYWNLVDLYGFDEDLINGNGGNRIALKLVMEGMKLQACQPGFIDGRDAILLADDILYNGTHACLIWHTFARRGLGLSASQGSPNSVMDGNQAFDLPEDCSETTDFSIGNNNIACVGDPISFQDISFPISESRTWSFPGGNPATSTAANPSVVYNSPGTYSVTLSVNTQAGNNTTTRDVIVNEKPEFILTANSALNGQDGSASVQVISGQSPYNIEFNTVPPVSNFEVGGLTPGFYSVSVSDATGCASVENFEIDNFVGLAELMQQQILVFPNPTFDGIIQLVNTSKEFKISSVEVLDISGRMIERVENSGQGSLLLDLSNRSKGVYYLNIVAGDFMISKKIVRY
jgi:hypothetical protein